MGLRDYHYYRFSTGEIGYRSVRSILPGLRGWIIGWGVVAIIAITPLSGMSDLKGDVSIGFLLALPLVGLLWLTALLGEAFPRFACWAVFSISLGVLVIAGYVGMKLYLSSDPLIADDLVRGRRPGIPTSQFGVAIAFMIYSALVSGVAAFYLRRHAKSAPAA